MNLPTLFGFLASTAIFLASVMLSFNNSRVILDWPSAMIVFGGTFAVTLVCFPLSQILTLLRVFLKRLFGKNHRDYGKLVREIRLLAETRRKGRKAFEGAILEVTDLFLKDAAKMLFWLKSDVTPDELRKMLETRAFTHYKSYMNEANIFRTLAKFPPAFGLMGTTLGMIALLQSLGEQDSAKYIGPAMALSLITTLYGIAISNMILIPISENLVKQTEEDQKARYMVVEGIMLIQAEKPPRFVEEHVKCFLLPSQRKDTSGDDAADHQLDQAS